MSFQLTPVNNNNRNTKNVKRKIMIILINPPALEQVLNWHVIIFQPYKWNMSMNFGLINRITKITK